MPLIRSIRPTATRRVLAAVPVTVEQFFVAGDRFRFHLTVRFDSRPLEDLSELGLVCQYRDRSGTVLAQPEVEFYEDEPTIGFVDLTPDTTRFMALATRPFWGLKWDGWPRTLVSGNVTVFPEVVVEETDGMDGVEPLSAPLIVEVSQ